MPTSAALSRVERCSCKSAVPVVCRQHHSCVCLPIAEVGGCLQCSEVFLTLTRGEAQGVDERFLRAPLQLSWNVA